MPEQERWSRLWGSLKVEGSPEPVYCLLSDLYSECSWFEFSLKYTYYHTLRLLSGPLHFLNCATNCNKQYQ